MHVPFYVRGPGIQPGSVRDEIVSNVDILPTLLDLAGVPIPAFADGRSLVPLLHAQTVDSASVSVSAAPAWRDHLLVEYYSVGTYYNDHSAIWQDGNETSVRCKANGPPRSPVPVDTCVEANGTGAGNCYFIDSVASNTWRLLRIMNSNENTAYIEYDPTWQFRASDPTGAGLQWCVAAASHEREKRDVYIYKEKPTFVKKSPLNSVQIDQIQPTVLLFLSFYIVFSLFFLSFLKKNTGTSCTI